MNLQGKLLKYLNAGTAEVKKHVAKTYSVAKTQFFDQEVIVPEHDHTHKSNKDNIFETQSSANLSLLSEVTHASYFGIRVMMIAIVVFFVWGGLAPLKIYVMAPSGSVVLSETRKTIQHYEGGIIKQILVHNGDAVVQDQVLLILQDTRAKAQVDSTRSQLLALQAIQARLVAEKDMKDDIEFPAELLESKDPEVIKAVENQKHLFASRLESLNGQIDIANQQIAQDEEVITGFEAQLNAMDKRIELTKGELKTHEKLFSKHLSLKAKLVDLQHNLQSFEGQRGAYLAQIGEKRQGIGATKLRIINARSQFVEKANKELEDVQMRISQAQENLNSYKDVLDRTVVRAPTAGIISNLVFHTVGGVIPQGHNILEIVPQDDILIVEAMLQPRDIEGVHVGQNAMVNLSAFKSRLVPRVKGKVIYVAPDVTQVQTGNGPASFYQVRVEVTQKELARLNYKVKLYPGMPAEIFIVVGEHTMLRWIFGPILDSMHRAFIEK